MMFNRIVWLIFSLMLAGLLLACGSTTTTTTITDVGRQAVLYEAPRGPHLKGPELKQGQASIATNYHVALKPQSRGIRAGVEEAPGGVTATHSFDLRVAKSIAVNGKAPHEPSWEIGLNLGLSHPDLSAPLAEDITVTDFEDLYYRAGFGLRGPLYFSDRLSLGMVFELDVSALPHDVDIVRNTDQDIETVREIWIPFGYHGGIIRTESESSSGTTKIEKQVGTTLHPQFRTGLYAAYYLGGRENPHLTLTGGLTGQTTPIIEGVVVQTYSCRDYEIFESPPEELARECRKNRGKEFPVIQNALAATLFAGLHLTIGELVLSTVIQSHMMMNSDLGYGAPISGDIELAWLF